MRKGTNKQSTRGKNKRPPGGLGGPGGRGTTTTKPPALPRGIFDKSAAQIARAAKRAAGTSYRAAMTAITAYANKHSKTMLPEQRTKLAKAKAAVRKMFDRPAHTKGAGGVK